MSPSTDLLIAPCPESAARLAVERWHYSHTMPASLHVTYGVWERGEFVGAVIFARGANRHLAQFFALETIQVAELVRVALREHRSPVSQIVALALARLHRANPGLRVVMSYADPNEGHHGGIYQAGNWLYLGLTDPTPYWRHRATGQVLHARATSKSGVGSMYGVARVVKTSDCDRIIRPGKHRYVMPLDKPTRRRLARLAQPYPLPVAVHAD